MVQSLETIGVFLVCCLQAANSFERVKAMREGIVAVRRHGDSIVSIMLLTGEFQQEEGVWLAECLELGVVAYASTLDEAKRDLSEAIDLQLNEVERLGFIEEYLKERRVQVHPVPKITAQPPEEQIWANVGLVGV